MFNFHHIVKTMVSAFSLAAPVQHAPEVAKDINTVLIRAIVNGDREEVQAALTDGADVNTVCADAYGGTPLYWAAKLHMPEIVELLIANGADVNNSGLLHKTVLHVAVKNGYWQIAQMLLKAGALVNVKDVRGRTPLFLAVANAQKPDWRDYFLNTVTLLLCNGADLGSKHTVEPLDLAAVGRHELIAMRLIIWGARLDPGSPLYHWFLGRRVTFFDGDQLKQEWEWQRRAWYEHWRVR